MHNGEETLRLTVCGPTVIHVVAGPGSPSAASPQQPWITGACKPGQFELTQDEKEATVTTSALKVTIELKEGNLVFRDSAGTTLLAERSLQPRSYVPALVNGEKVYGVDDVFFPEPREGFYGLGQHQNGMFNYRGAVVELGQGSTDVAVPFLISSNGYGMLWNTAGLSYFDNRFAGEMKLSTAAADAVDYYFFYGPEMDQVIHQYREMTGHAPLFAEIVLACCFGRYSATAGMLQQGPRVRPHERSCARRRLVSVRETQAIPPRWRIGTRKRRSRSQWQSRI